MVVFCTQCWEQVEANALECPNCGTELARDSRTYEQELIEALNHPLPISRLRACWIIAARGSDPAANKLMALARNDSDLVVRHAAVQALGRLSSPGIIAFLEGMVSSRDRWLETEIRKSVDKLKSRTQKHAKDKTTANSISDGTLC